MAINQAELAAFTAETEALWGERVADSWSPDWCSHVIGLFTSRSSSLEGFEPQRWRCFCFGCKTEHRGVCLAGAVRNHVCHFASAHLHRDPMKVGLRKP